MPVSEAWMLCKSGTQRLLRGLLLNVLVCLSLSYADNAVQVDDFQLQRSDEGIFLSTRLNFELPSSLEDALNRGMPLSFVIQADVVRERWYWADKLVNRTDRYIRLSYQPLSKRWRMYVSPMLPPRPNSIQPRCACCGQKVYIPCCLHPTLPSQPAPQV